MIQDIDDLLDSIQYRKSFHKDEAQELLEPLGATLEWHREYLTKAEFANVILDLRLIEMEAPLQEAIDGEIQEELDALVGADLSAG